MNGFQVTRQAGGKQVTLGIGSERTARQTAEDMSRFVGGVLQVVNPCGQAVARFEDGCEL